MEVDNSDILKALVQVVAVIGIFGSLWVPKMRIMVGLLLLGLCTAAVIVAIMAAIWGDGSGPGFASVLPAFLVLLGFGSAFMVWGVRTTSNP